MNARRYLESVGSEVKNIFIENRMILAFEEWMELFLQDPARHARSAAQYLRDSMDHFGTRQVSTPMGPQRRFNLFDRAFDGGDGKVAGQEEVQNEIYRILGNFIRAGRANRLIVLHGPNGAAKSTLVSALVRGLEVYSRQPEGALYKINWMFPAEKLVKGPLGFGGGRPFSTAARDSFAHLESEDVDARVTCEMKDHPLFLLPHGERRKLLREKLRGKEFVLSKYVLEGELCHKCRQIYSGLLAAYSGDYLKVLQHVQVERFYVSRRYLSAAVAVEPQISVDASYHQVTADRSVGQLPPSLQNLEIFEPFGPLVYANRGICEYSDLLKRPIDSYRYLLGTIESGVLPMEHFLLHLDQVMIGTANEKQLAHFKEMPDFASFKGRLALVRVPYLRRLSDEVQIYETQIRPEAVGKHLAPHATRVAAAWAVLTRLRRPEPGHYEPPLRDLVEDLAPIEKLRLYDDGRVPDRLDSSQAELLRSAVGQMWHEWDVSPAFEGRDGASAREIRTVILNAAQDPAHRCLTPVAVLAELGRLSKERSVYEYLKAEPRDGYHDVQEFLRVVEAEYLDKLDDEVREALGLVTEGQYEELFARYVASASHWIRGERIADERTGAHAQPAGAGMEALESLIKPASEDHGSFRRSLIGAAGAWRLEHPGEQEVVWSQVFPGYFRRLRDHFYEERKMAMRRVADALVRHAAGEELDGRERAAVDDLLRNMRERFGYCDECARESILHLLRARYGD